MWIDLDQVLASQWIYLVVACLIMVDVYLPITPSGTTLIAATVYAHTGDTSPLALLAVAAVASTCGDAVAFRVARRGRGAIHRLVARQRHVSLADAKLRSLLRANLARTVLFARFVPAGRMIVTFGSGIDGRITQRRFQPWSVAAAVCWATYTVMLGQLSALLFDVTWVGAVVAVVCLTCLGALLARTRMAAELSG